MGFLIVGSLCVLVLPYIVGREGGPMRSHRLRPEDRSLVRKFDLLRHRPGGREQGAERAVLVTMPERGGPRQKLGRRCFSASVSTLSRMALLLSPKMSSPTDTVRTTLWLAVK